MAKASAFGSITIIDVTDIGEFSVYPMSNLPLSVVYSPDDNAYNPNWSSNNLVLTPSVYYAGKALTLGTSGLSISWQKMTGITSTALNSNETTASNGVLTVKANQFSDASALITYIVTATYVEPTSNTTLTAQGQITFSLVKMASEVRNIVVTGNNIFKYDTNGTCNVSSTTLTATATNTNIVDWEYSNNGGSTWASFGKSTSTLTINENATQFGSSDSLIVRVKACDKQDSTSFYYDYTTILKLRDGAPGNSTIAMVLGNEDQMIPCDSKGAPTTNAFNLAYTSCIVYEGGKDVTSDYTVTATPTGVVGGWTNSTSTKPSGSADAATKGSYAYYWVTGWGASNANEIGYVTFTATKGTTTIEKTMSLSKIKTGADGVSPEMYSLDVSSLVVNKTYTYSTGNTISATNYSPTSIVATATKTVGTTDSAYAGYLKVFLDDVTTTAATATMTGGTYTFSNIGSTHKPTKYIRFELYSGSGADGKLLDTQRVMVTSDGSKGNTGSQGNPGVDATNVVLGNYADTIAVTTGYQVPSATTITIPFSGYKGTAKVACTISNPPTLFGVAGTVTNATASADGKIEYVIPTTATCGSSTVKTGTLPLTFTCNGTTVTCNYTWTISVAATNGQNARILQISTPNGYVYSNGEGSLTIQADLMNGASIQTSSVTYKWYKYTSSGYTQITATNANASTGTAGFKGITGYDTKTLTVPGTCVDGYGSFKCEATYSSTPYTGFASLIDKTDPVQVSVMSTVGTQIVNGQGVGAVYAIVTRDGKEIDSMPAGVQFVTVKPSSMKTGDYYYFLDATNKTATLKKATSSTGWSTETESYTGTYTWSYRDAENKEATGTTPAKSGKVVYVDASLIDKKLIIDVEVEI